MFKKLFLTAVLTVSLTAVLPVFAQATDKIAPEFNPLCWKKKDCMAIRADVGAKPGSKTAGSGFISEDPCVGGTGDDEWGKCLPAGTANTEISFGGENSFTGIGDFMLKNYRFAISVAAILAVIVIVMSGFQWTMSAGNSEVITSAKHRIGNAIIGLFITYSSYFILSTINPDLVNLRLPSTYMVRPFSEIPKFCSVLEVKAEEKGSRKMFLEAAPLNDQTKQVSMPAQVSWASTYNDLFGEGAVNNCGARYFFDGGGAGTCFGNMCPSGKSCTNLHFANRNNTEYSCESGILFGSVTANYVIPPICGVVAGYHFPFIDNNHNINRIYKVCKDNSLLVDMKQVSAPAITFADEENNMIGFTIGALSNSSQDCGQEKKFLGYALGLELNKGICINTDDDVAIDKFGNAFGKLNAGNGDNYYASNVTKQVSEKDFWTYEELQKGQQINVNVTNITPQ